MSLETAFEIGQQTLQIKRIADVITGAKDKIFLELPGIEAWFPGGPTHDTGRITNIVMDNNSLIQVGTCPIGFDGHSFRHLGDGTNYLSGAGQGLTGTETYIDTVIRGFTIGGWIWADASPGVSGGVIGKDGTSANRGYSIEWTSANKLRLNVSLSGGTGPFAISLADAAVGAWHFVVGRFTPATELAIFVDGVKDTNTTAIPASCNVSSQNFEIGRYFNDNSRILHGRCRDVFICASALTDDLIALIRATSM